MRQLLLLCFVSHPLTIPPPPRPNLISIPYSFTLSFGLSCLLSAALPGVWCAQEMGAGKKQHKAEKRREVKEMARQAKRMKVTDRHSEWLR